MKSLLGNITLPSGKRLQFAIENCHLLLFISWVFPLNMVDPSIVNSLPEGNSQHHFLPVESADTHDKNHGDDDPNPWASRLWVL